MTANSDKVIAFLLYPGLSLLDMIGPYSVLSNLGRGYRTVVVGEKVESMPDDFGLGITPHLSIDDVPKPYALIVPGADLATFTTMANDKLMAYIRSAGEKAEVVCSVCTGACILAQAGFLKGRKATTHWAYAPFLEKLGATYIRQRWVEDGKFITAAGVSAGIDLALHLAARFADEAASKAVQLYVEYEPQPPFGGLDWSMANEEAISKASAVNLSERLADMDKVLANKPELLAQLKG